MEKASWYVMMWLENDKSTYNMVLDQVEQSDNAFEFAEWLKRFVEDGNPLTEESSMYSDLLNYALSLVDYDEIAKSYWADYRE